MKDFLTNIIIISRLHKPRPILLLYFPCLWGLFLTYNPAISTMAFVKASVIFLVGAIAGRAAGCILNDIIDKDIDAKVERTKDRPLASGKMQLSHAILLLLTWISIGLYCLAVFNTLARLFILLGFVIAIIYPFTKRFTYYAQVVLGMAFNIGIFVGYAAVYKYISAISFMLYIAGIYYTLIYDTIYASQDVEDDEKLNLKSMAMLYKGNLVISIMKNMVMFIGVLIVVGILERFGTYYYAFFILYIPLLFKMLHFTSNKKYQQAFNFSIYIPILLTVQILISRILLTK